MRIIFLKSASIKSEMNLILIFTFHLNLLDSPKLMFMFLKVTVHIRDNFITTSLISLCSSTVKNQIKTNSNQI